MDKTVKEAIPLGKLLGSQNKKKSMIQEKLIAINN